MWNIQSSGIEQELSAGERLLWSGQPRRGIRFRLSDALVIPFSILWCGFAVFWEFSVIDKGAPLFFTIWGIPFVVVGLYMVFGRFFADAWMRERAIYGVTSERIIIIGGLMSRQTKSIQLRTLGEVSLRESADRSGDITFGPQQPWGNRVRGWPGAGQNASPAFEMVDGVKEVYDLIRRTQKTAQ
jgi:hypothetical protein